VRRSDRGLLLVAAIAVALAAIFTAMASPLPPTGSVGRLEEHLDAAPPPLPPACAPPSYIDQRGDCWDPVAALARWRADHPAGIGPRRLGVAVDRMSTTGAPPCAGKFKIKQYARANFFPAWNRLGSRVTECIRWPDAGPPPWPYPPNNSYPDPDSVWGLHKGVPDPGGTGTMVTTNYLINCDAELFTGSCSQVFADTFDCQLQMTPQELSEYTEWAAAARYPATPAPCPASPFVVDGFEGGSLSAWR
jgi:hypothetical protein